MANLFRLQPSGRLTSSNLIDYDYALGTDKTEENSVYVPANKRAMILPSMSADAQYTLGINAYRAVDYDVNNTGIVNSAIATPPSSPYIPETEVAFNGNILGTINGIPAVDINVWNKIIGSEAVNTLIAQAQADATAANNALTNIASDSILSPSEKSSVVQSYNIIIGEQSNLDIQATNYSVTTEKTTYDTAITALTTYLGTLTGWNTIPGGNVTIVGTTFRTKFSDVYIARQNLLSAILAASKTLVNTAQTTADAANTALTNIASDSILSPSEKPTVVLDYANIINEQSGIDSQATTYGITTEKTTYDTAVTALTTYLGTLTGWNTIPGGDVAIVGTTFRTKFSDVYTARQAVLNKITGNAKVLADAAQTQANTATTNAATAQTSANTANTAIADIADDNKLTPSEKQAIRLQWNTAISEKAGLNATSALYSATSTENTAYNAAIQALGTYLNAGVAYTLSTSVPPTWINDASLNTATTIVGSTFRSNWKDLYDTRQALLNDIAVESGKVALWSNIAIQTGAPASNATVGLTLNEDPQALNAASWTIPSGINLISTAVSGAVCPKIFDSVDYTTGQDKKVISVRQYPIEPTRTYELTANLYVGASNDRQMFIFVNFYDIAGTIIASSATTPNWGGAMSGYVFGGLPTAGFSRQGGKFGSGVSATRPIPTNARTVQIGVWFQYSGSGTSNLEQGAQDIRLTDVTEAYTAQLAAAAAQTQANTATTNAATAQTAANTANTALTNIASDNILSPSEKPPVVQDYAVITGEQAGIDAQATSYSITTEKTSYDTAVSALTTYLGTLSGWNTIPGSDVVIVGTTFRTKFSDVYTARQVLLNAISAKAKVLADAAQTQANTATTNAATAQTKADTAFTNAATAQTAADAANTALTNIASDNILSPSEKPAVVLDYANIINEQSGIDAQATAYVITTEKTTYDSAVTALTTYLGTLTGWNTIPGSDVVIVGTTFRTKFSDVYTARQTLLNKISANAKVLADAAQTQANTATTNAATANTAINDATTGLAQRMRLNADNILGGVISANTVASPVGFRAGNVVWNAAGAWVSGSGVAMTPTGLVGYNSAGVAQFSINATTGAATFAGALGAATGSFAGSLSAVTGTFNTLTISGAGGYMRSSNYVAGVSGFTFNGDGGGELGILSLRGAPTGPVSSDATPGSPPPNLSVETLITLGSATAITQAHIVTMTIIGQAYSPNTIGGTDVRLYQGDSAGNETTLIKSWTANNTNFSQTHVEFNESFSLSVAANGSRTGSGKYFKITSSSIGNNSNTTGSSASVTFSTNIKGTTT